MRIPLSAVLALAASLAAAAGTWAQTAPPKPVHPIVSGKPQPRPSGHPGVNHPGYHSYGNQYYPVINLDANTMHALSHTPTPHPLPTNGVTRNIHGQPSPQIFHQYQNGN